MIKLPLTAVLTVLALSLFSLDGVAADKFLADRHAPRGANCVSCHGDQKPSKDVINHCLKCHVSYDEVAKRTDKGDINFHDTHLGDANCSQCHHGHSNSQLVCAHCHDFKAKVP